MVKIVNIWFVLSSFCLILTGYFNLITTLIVKSFQTPTELVGDVASHFIKSGQAYLE